MTQPTGHPAYVILGAGQLGLTLMDVRTETGRPIALVNRSSAMQETLDWYRQHHNR